MQKPSLWLPLAIQWRGHWYSPLDAAKCFVANVNSLSVCILSSKKVSYSKFTEETASFVTSTVQLFISAPIRAQIVRHINIHSEVKPYTCSECGKGFNFKQKVSSSQRGHQILRICWPNRKSGLP